MERMVANDIEMPKFVWHNATSATLLTAIPTDIIQSRCQAVTFSCGVTLRANGFSRGTNYARNPINHDAAVAFCSANGIPFLYIDAEAMGFSSSWLSNLPNYNSAWPDIFPESVWAKAIDHGKDRVTVRAMRWVGAISGDKPAETTAQAGEYFSTPNGFLPSWANEAFNNTSYSNCDIDAARGHSHTISQKLKCPVNVVMGALAGMVVDQRVHQDCLAVPVSVDFANNGVSLRDPATAKTFLLMVTSKKVEIEFTTVWLKFLDVVHRGAPAASGITIEAAESWMTFREQMKRPLAAIVRWEKKEAEKKAAASVINPFSQQAQQAREALSRGDMYWICQKALH